MADRTADDVEEFLKQVRELGDEVGGPWSPTAEVELLLGNTLLNDSEARLLGYLECVGSMPVADVAVIFGWTRSKTYYFVQKLERVGKLRRIGRDIWAK